jgi:hypothetical protein
MKSLVFAAILTAALASSFSARTINLYADDKETEKVGEYKPVLVPYEEYYKDMLKMRYEYYIGKEYDPRDTTFFFNSYKIMVDTNARNAYVDGENFPSEPYFWVKKYIQVKFTERIFDIKVDKENSITYYTLADVKPKFEKTRKDLENLERMYGKFRFVDLEPDVPDDHHIFNKELYLEFENYIPAHTGHYFAKNLLDTSVLCVLQYDVDKIEWPFLIKGFTGKLFEMMNGNVNNINEIRTFSLEVYPTVANEQITINLNNIDLALPNAITIIDTNGKVVKLLYTGLDMEQTINVSDLPNGHYFIKSGKFVGQFTVRR